MNRTFLFIPPLALFRFLGLIFAGWIVLVPSLPWASESSGLDASTTALTEPITIIPLNQKNRFLNLKYSNIKPNEVTLEKTIAVKVNESASPLFYPLKTPKIIKSISLIGQVDIKKPITDGAKDAYFQLGVVYLGDYKPGGIAQWLAPDWIMTIIQASQGRGLGLIHFYDVSPPGKNQNRTSKHGGISIVSETISYLDKNQFELKIQPSAQEVLGFWLNMEGDDSRAEFKVHLEKLYYLPLQ